MEMKRWFPSLEASVERRRPVLGFVSRCLALGGRFAFHLRHRVSRKRKGETGLTEGFQEERTYKGNLEG